MNRLSNADRSRVVACLVEGNSIRSTTRITGISKIGEWTQRCHQLRLALPASSSDSA